MRNWLIKVNATMYNILGGVREFCQDIPWYFGADEQIQVGDIVFFYLTDSKTKNKKYGYNVVDPMFKRFLFKGVVISVSDGGSNVSKYWKDDKYWNDLNYRAGIKKSENHRFAEIRITELLYDYNIKSDTVDSRIWNIKYANKDVYELDDAMVNSINQQIPQ